MNKWNRLLAMLDEVFGFENKVKSTFKKVSQDFDEKTNEHVFLIEYCIRVGQGQQKAQPKKVAPQRADQGNMSMLRQLVDRG